jgi:hypothetical protein
MWLLPGMVNDKLNKSQEILGEELGVKTSFGRFIGEHGVK